MYFDHSAIPRGVVCPVGMAFGHYFDVFLRSRYGRVTSSPLTILEFYNYLLCIFFRVGHPSLDYLAIYCRLP